MITNRDNEYLKEFGRNLMHIRTQKSLSLRELAQQCDIDHSDIAKFERGEVNITIVTAIHLAKALNVPVTTLFATLDKNK